MQDVTPYPVSLMWEDASESVMKQVQDGSKVLMREALVTSEVNYENKSALISMNNSVPTSKLVSFKNKEKPFELVALYEQGEGNSQIANARPVLGRWVVSNMPAASTNADEAPSKIKVSIYVFIACTHTVQR